MANLKQLGEFGLIERFQSQLDTHSPRVKKGIGDDCAIFSAQSDKIQLISTDALVESIHFDLKKISAEQLGRKAMAVNISDIAAMGGNPYLAVISLGLPKSTSIKFLDKFYSGLQACCNSHKIKLAGGDTVYSPTHLFINICILGEAKKNRVFTRTGAKPGDHIFVTGTLGDSAMGLKLLMSKNKNFKLTRYRRSLIQKHIEPIPRIKESNLLAKSKLKVTSMIDLSDGLAQGLSHLCLANKLGAEIFEANLPFSEALKNICQQKGDILTNLALHGGEDYELLFTIRQEDVKKLNMLFLDAGTPVSHIGEITKLPGKMTLKKKTGRVSFLKPSMGFNHFR